MAQEKMVLVPQAKLDAIEEARLKLYELLKPQMNSGSVQDPKKFRFLLAVQEITDPMWQVANTKWEEAK